APEKDIMDGSSFDRLTRRFGVTTSRRGGVAGALGIAGISTAEAVVPVPPVCRSTGMECADGIPCCSGRCIAKRDGTMRCARKTSNRKPANHQRKNRDACLELTDVCTNVDQCCTHADATVRCTGQDGYAEVCCLSIGDSCTTSTDCCGYWDNNDCVNGECTAIQ
ncbi:MAG: hypothetical protein ACKOCK_07500, partial [Chloroflexota bacterium]